MNERQLRLYKTLIDLSKKCSGWNSKEFLCELLSDDYPRYLENQSEHASTSFLRLRKDIRAINKSDDAEVIIISSPKGYKAATEKEAYEFIKKRFKRDLKSLKINWKLVNKYKLNGQINIDMKEVKSFIDGKAI